MASEQLIKAGIQFYTGSVVKDIKVSADPKVPDSYAVRVHMQDGEQQDYVLCASWRGDGRRHITLQDIADNLEEASFESWPPPSGNLRFFV